MRAKITGAIQAGCDGERIRATRIQAAHAPANRPPTASTRANPSEIPSTSRMTLATKNTNG